MTISPSPGRRKRRLVRPEGPSDDLLLVIRAMPVSRSAAVDQMVEVAEFSARLYVLEGEGGSRELLYGISVFAHGAGLDRAASLTVSEQRRCSWRHQSARQGGWFRGDPHRYGHTPL